MLNIKFDTTNLDKECLSFFPGGEWLYFNIYANQNCTDIIIKELVKIIIAHNNNLFFFFTRYYDNSKGDHLRLRIKLNDLQFTNLILIFNQYFKHSPLVLNASIETYHREISRYGWPTILDVENLFFVDSKIIYTFLSNRDTIDDIKKIEFCQFNINHYLECLHVFEKDKILFVKTAKDDFFNEFDINSVTKKSMNALYKKYCNSNVDNSYDDIEDLLNHRKKICNRLVSTYTLGYNHYSFIWSLIHMFSNKLFSKNYRIYEMISYNYLEKYLLKTFWSSKNDNNYEV